MESRVPSEEELRLWKAAIGDVEPLADRDASQPAELHSPAGSPRQQTHSPSPRQVARPYTPSLDRNTAKRLSSGKIKPDVSVDLHGLTLDQANRRIHDSISQALAIGHRLLLVITGRGGKKLTSEEHGKGRIRASMESWIRNGPHRNQVVDIRQAHFSHGGAGAYYVYLKKNRVEGARGFEPRTR